jgi:hypothetical protein
MSQLLEVIRTQAAVMAAGGNTLSSAAVAMAYTDWRAILRVRWTLNMAERRNLGGVEAANLGRTEDMVVLLDRCTEAEILDAAWLLGAWDVLRTEHPPIPKTQAEARSAGFIYPIPDNMLGDRDAPAWGLTASFCGCPYMVNGEPLAQGECPLDLLDIAAAGGWIDWAFRPTAWSVRIRSNNDRTLNPDGTRNPRELPIMPAPLADRPHQHIYRLGRAPHGNRSKRQRERKADGA